MKKTRLCAREIIPEKTFVSNAGVILCVILRACIGNNLQKKSACNNYKADSAIGDSPTYGYKSIEFPSGILWSTCRVPTQTSPGKSSTTAPRFPYGLSQIVRERGQSFQKRREGCGCLPRFFLGIARKTSERLPDFLQRRDNTLEV